MKWQLPGASEAIWLLRGLPQMAANQKKDFWRAFIDFFILFSGISTASNLARTQGKPLLTRGLFLFRSGRSK
jgi:hypothetical protein